VATPNDIAFVMGVDGYATSPLPSCVNDATKMAELLRRNADNVDPAACSDNFTVELQAFSAGDRLLSRQQFLRKLRDLIGRAADHDFLFYFSGHGATSDWGSDLVIADDATVNMQELLQLIHISRVRQAVIILDCCFSGSYGLLPGMGAQADRFSPKVSLIRDNVMLLAASKADEGAAAGHPFSAFTELLVSGLDGGAADHRGVITAPALFGYAAPAFGPLDQRPMFKASISATESLRTVLPEIDLGAVRRISDYFTGGQDTLRLTGTETAGEQLFDDLVVLREGGLIRCPDERQLSAHVADQADIQLSAAGVRLRLLAERGMA
jgi:hypothetical protein